VSIRTPDQRLRVFVSSTLQELAEDRRVVREAIEGLRLTPVMFELGARPHAPRALYRAYLEQSDVFIGLYWERYGWIAPGERLSGLEDEYSMAGDRPKLIYIKTPAPDREPQLSRMIGRIQLDDCASYRPFSDAEELRSLVADDLAVLLTERFSTSMAPRAGRPLWQTYPPLPRPLTRLIGRDADVAGVLDLLAQADNRLVTVFGTAGVGKTRVALEVAERGRDRYPDGIAYVELAAVSEPGLVLPAIATALGVPEGAGTSLAGRLRDRLAESRVLIVLDNMEQLTDAAGDISELLAMADGAQILVTSRRTIRGERVFELTPLAVPADGAITPAVELFLERARAIRPEFEPTTEDMAAIAELSRRLDGLPLAIELASAWMRILSPRAVLERMGHRRLQLLRTGPRDLPWRQRTLRDTVAWSYSLLAPTSRRLFTRLAVFVGSADFEAIDQVANPDGQLNTLELLSDLVEQSLVQAAGDATEPRFAMFETIREFAVEQLDANSEAAKYRARHEAYYVELAERGDAALGTADQVEWLDRLGRENDNLRAVLRRAVRRGDAVTAVRMGLALTTYWYMHGSHSEGRAWMQQVAALPSAGPQERSAAWTIAAIQAFWQGDPELLAAGVEDGVRLGGQTGDRRVLAYAQLLRELASGALSDDDARQARLMEASRRLEAGGVPLTVGFGLLARSYDASLHGRMAEAQELAQAAHDLSTSMGESWLGMIASTLLARAAIEFGDTDAAQRHVMDSLLAAQRLRNLNVTSYALELWAAAELRAGRAERAGRLFALAERGYRQAGARPWGRDTLHERLTAELQAAIGARYEQSLTEARELDFDQAIAQLVRSRPSSRRPPEPD
jgi:predicted ATPase